MVLESSERTAQGYRQGVYHRISPPLCQVGAPGSPLPGEDYRWFDEQFGPEVLLNVGSGGTDVCTGIVQGGPLQPVYAGEIGAVPGGRRRRLRHGRPFVVGELGELVTRRPMPSMPVGFWNDPGRERYRAAYFEDFRGVWRHGDWILITERGSCIVVGRSDATLNRGGVRLGTGTTGRTVAVEPQPRGREQHGRQVHDDLVQQAALEALPGDVRLEHDDVLAAGRDLRARRRRRCRR